MTCKSKEIISMILTICLTGVSHLSPYYTMRFPYVALAIKPNTNEMNTQYKWFYLYYTLICHLILDNFGLYVDYVKEEKEMS